MMVKATDEDSKLTPSKKKILMACAGHADPATFVVPAVYKDIYVEGGTTDELGRILRHWLKSIPFSPYKMNIHVTPQLVATVKALSFFVKQGQDVLRMHQEHDSLCHPVAHGGGHE
jgi:hypothetical protein